jgi:Ser/Thr protein kinase RdoA (MazF antagonist)
MTGAVLDSRPPAINDMEAVSIARRHFGLAVTADRLSGERDVNFRLTTIDGSRYLLKVTNAAEDPVVTDFQTQALLHIERKEPELPVPRVQRTSDGKCEFRWRSSEGAESVVRLLSFLEGEPIVHLPRTLQLRESIGASIAMLDRALEDYCHPGSDHELLWDIKNASKLRSMLSAMGADPLGRVCERMLDVFEARILPRLPSLRWQVIHNDCNLHNILADSADHDRVGGILDFGDMVRTPRVMELAVAGSYHVDDGGHPLRAVGEIVRAYHGVVPLGPDELELLLDLICARLVTTVLITNSRALLYPENRNYILRNNSQARQGLAAIERFPREQLQSYFHLVCEGAVE